MVLELFWDDINGKSYNIAGLERKDGMYYLHINYPELKEATHNGCFGIGNIDFLQETYVSKELFQFFKSRIPANKRGLPEKYDEMEILKATQGRLKTDRYYLLEQNT